MSYIAAARKGQLFPSRLRPPCVYRPPATQTFDYTAFFHAKPPNAKPKNMPAWRHPRLTSKQLPSDDARRLRSFDLGCAIATTPTPATAPKAQQTFKTPKRTPAPARGTTRRATPPPTAVSAWYMVVWIMAVWLWTGCVQLTTTIVK
jgi:hypothetical protein